MFMNGYKPDVKDPRYNLIADPKGNRDLPTAAFQIDGLDPLRDEGLIYERILRENGIKTKLYMYPGLPHGHFGFFPFLEGSNKFRKEQVESMSWLLGKEADMSKVKTDAEMANV